MGTSNDWLAILLRQGYAGQVRSSEPCFAKATQGMLRSSQGSERSMVGAAGLEPATSCTPSKRASQLRYAPNLQRILSEHSLEVNERMW